jgi:hypothetical protein
MHADIQWYKVFFRSNLGLQTGYLDVFFVIFLSPSMQRPGHYLKLGHGRFIPYFPVIIYS